MKSSKQDVVLELICSKVRGVHPQAEWYDYIISGALLVANHIEEVTDEARAAERTAAVLISSIDMIKSIRENRFTEELGKHK